MGACCLKSEFTGEDEIQSETDDQPDASIQEDQK